MCRWRGRLPRHAGLQCQRSLLSEVTRSRNVSKESDDVSWQGTRSTDLVADAATRRKENSMRNRLTPLLDTGIALNWEGVVMTRSVREPSHLRRPGLRDHQLPRHRTRRSRLLGAGWVSGQTGPGVRRDALIAAAHRFWVWLYSGLQTAGPICTSGSFRCLETSSRPPQCAGSGHHVQVCRDIVNTSTATEVCHADGATGVLETQELARSEALFVSAPGRIRTCATASGGRCSIP